MRTVGLSVDQKTKELNIEENSFLLLQDLFV